MITRFYFLREQQREKPRILSQLIQQGYNVQEVNFFTMLSIVQSCQELRNERMHNELKLIQNSEIKAESKKTNYLTVFKGILPGRLYLLLCFEILYQILF